MARDTGRTDTDLTVVFQEEEEVGAELISMLTQQQRCVGDVYNDLTARAYLYLFRNCLTGYRCFTLHVFVLWC
jgi:hypothetical protein